MNVEEIQTPSALSEPPTMHMRLSSFLSRVKRYKKGALIFAVVFYIAIMVKDSWLGDDAFITLRTVDNFINGYGLTWNIDERVQTYTHPLWMFLVSLVSFVIRTPYTAALLLGLGVSIFAILLFALRLVKSPLLAAVGVMCLAASKSFIDYSTSGLENPLTHLLIVLFAFVFYQCQNHRRFVLWLSLLSMLMVLNRLDTVLLFLPGLLYVLWQRRSWRTLITMVLAFVPFLCWELFSLFYYGSAVPNTAYAKLNLGVSLFTLIKMGLGYFISSFTFDPILAIVIALTFVMVLVKKDWKSLPLLCGMALYMGYVVRVGGDFMAGRFLTPPFLIAVILLTRNVPSKVNWYLALLFGIALLFGVVTPYTRWSLDPLVVYGSGTTYQINHHFIDKRNITDERFYYASAVSILRWIDGGPLFEYQGGAAMGRQARASGTRVVVFSGIGMLGYEAGPHVHILDPYALGDPLLARLPVDPSWRAGQFTRHLPAGYLATVQNGQNRIADPDLARYYDVLHFVISGPLFSWPRMVEIWKLNTGGYNSLLQQYFQRHPPGSFALPGPTWFVRTRGKHVVGFF